MTSVVGSIKPKMLSKTQLTFVTALGVFLTLAGSEAGTSLKMDLMEITGKTETGHGYRFWYGNTSLGWTEAMLYCVNRGASLVSIKNSTAQQAIESALWNNPSLRSELWISLHRKDLTSPWRWGDDTPLGNYTNWYSFEPQLDDYFVAIEGRTTYLGTWWGNGKTVTRRFLCE